MHIRSQLSREPRQRCYLFQELVRKQDYPQYYQIIANPIAMNTIRKKIKNNEYHNLRQYVADWRLMFDNARTFNETDSLVYKDAEIMQVRKYTLIFYMHVYFMDVSLTISIDALCRMLLPGSSMNCARVANFHHLITMLTMLTMRWNIENGL